MTPAAFAFKVPVLFLLFLLGLASEIQAQTPDTTVYRSEVLPGVTFREERLESEHGTLPEVGGAPILAGKKAEVVSLDRLPVPPVTQSVRQILAKIPGLHVWESDPSGLQVGIATRGLSPNRSWEFNIRQNGADIAADPLGYPEAYYTPPMQAVQEIQIRRGSSALQYGTQFGGSVNYVLKNAEGQNERWAVSATQTLGSYGLLGTFVDAGFKAKTGSVYGFYDRRLGNGWRENSVFESQTLHAGGRWRPSAATEIQAEFTRFTMLSQQPGGLTDSILRVDPRTSLRSRNWFTTPWNTAQIRAVHRLARGVWETSVFTTHAARKSVGFLGALPAADTAGVNPTPVREIAVDRYTYVGMESKMGWSWKSHRLSAGVRGFSNRTLRQQKGIGSSGGDADFSPAAGFGTELSLRSQSASAFAEVQAACGPRWSVIPGIRWEGIQTFGTAIPKMRSVPLVGVALQYRGEGATMYANWTQNYRPLLFSELGAPAIDEAVDPYLSDVRGSTAEWGYRVRRKRMQAEATLFFMEVQGRVGRVLRTDENGQEYVWRTNVGDSRAWGLEALVDAEPRWGRSKWSMPCFVSGTVQEAIYAAGPYRGNAVENAPRWTVRSGAGLARNWGGGGTPKSWGVHLQWSSVGAVFSDAANTLKPSTNATVGRIPNYNLLDISAQIKPNDQLSIKVSIQNATQERYFTRRAGGYPGPGALPGDARTMTVALTIRM